MKRILALLLALCLLIPGYALADWSAELEMMLEKGAQFVQKQDFDSALICYDIAAKLAPEDAAVPAALAAMYISREDYQQALDCIEDALALAPANGSLYLTKAKILYRLNKIEEADLAIRYARICGAAPDNTLLVTAAVAYSHAGQYAKAIEAFDAIPLYVWWDSHADVYGNALIRTGNLDLAQDLGLLEKTYKDEVLAQALQNQQDMSLAEFSEDITGYPVFCSVAYYEENKESARESGAIGEVTGDGLRVKLYENLVQAGASSDNISLLSASPSGNARLYGVDGIIGVVKNGEITILTVNEARGAQNEEDYEAYSYKRYDRFSSLSGREVELDGVVWSPDERYIALTFPTSSIQRMWCCDLLLLDTHTGEVFVTEATPTKYTQEGCQMALCARFDQFSENVYYIVYGRFDESRSALKRYNLSTGQAELLCTTGDVWMCYPQLGMDHQGQISGITDQNKRDASAGTIAFSEENGVWKCEVSLFDNPISIQYAKRYEYSANNDLSLIFNLFSASRLTSEGKTATNIVRNYLTLRSSNPVIQHQDKAIMLPWEGSKAEAVTVNEDFIQAYSKPTQEVSWRPVLASALSPDGFYALVLTNNRAADQEQTTSLHLLDLQTLDFTTINLTEEQSQSLRYTAVTPQISWLDGHQILIRNGNYTMMFSLEF